MQTFAELYCRRNHCTPRAFKRAIFWRTLHPRALLLAPLLMPGNYFESDRGLIEACAGATCMEQINQEIGIHPVHAHHGRWLHHYARVRISTRRLRQLAACYLMKAETRCAVAGRFLPSARR